MAHILITGATGYLGTVLVPLLMTSSNRHRVTLAVRDPTKLKLFPLPPRATGQIAWVTLPTLLAGDLDLPTPDVICHLAKGRNNNPREVAESLELMAAIVGLAREWAVKQFIYTSSQAVYGMAPHPWAENSPPAPVTLYGMMNYASELLLHSARASMPSIRAISLRLAKLVGPAPVFRLDQGEAPHLMAAHALAGRHLTIDGNRNQILDFLDVRDAAAIILGLVEHTGEQWPEVLNLGGGSPITLAELAQLTSSITAERYGKPLAFTITDQGSQLRHFDMSIDCLRGLFPDFTPTPLKQTIADICTLLDASRSAPG